VNFDYESVLQNDNAKTRINYLMQFMETCLMRMIKALDPKYKTSLAGASLTPEALSLIYTIKADIEERKVPDITKDEVNSYILSILFEPLIQRLVEMNKEKLADYYWDTQSSKGVVPNDKVFKFTEKRNLVYVLADNMEKYFKRTKIHFQNEACHPLKEFIKHGCKYPGEPKYREMLGDLIDHSPLMFDYLLVKDIFVNSMQFENPTLTISVKDLIYIYNNIVEKKDEILFKDFEDDPIGLAIDELGSLPIESKQGDRVLISEQILEYKLNVDIKARILEHTDSLTKCADCHAPVYQDLISPKRWREATNGKQWLCNNQAACRAQNKLSHELMECPNCKKFRDHATLPKDQIFVKFKDTDNDPLVPLFEQILVYLPTIEAM
jgi:hypothetical protein